MSLAFYFLI